MEELNNARYVPLLVLGTLSGVLSLFGSSCILYMSFREKPKSMKHRLLFCLSLADIVLSISLLTMPFAVPSKLGLPGAVGNPQTCSTTGFFFLASYKMGCYLNAYLSVYFLLVVRYNWKEHDFTRPWEFGAHLVAFLLVLGIDIAAVATQSINPTPLFHNVCAYAESPWACGDEDGVECQRSTPQTANLFILALAGPFFLFFSLLGFVCTGMVWVTVRTTFRKSSVHRFENTIQASGHNCSDGGRSAHTQQQSLDTNQERLRQVGIQAVLYSLAYFNAFFWPNLILIASRTVPTIDLATSVAQSPGWYALKVFYWTFFPLQGFLTFFVYTRAKVHFWRQNQPQASLWWIYRQIVAGATIPQSHRSCKTNHMRKSGEASLTQSKSEAQATGAVATASEPSKSPPEDLVV